MESADWPGERIYHSPWLWFWHILGSGFSSGTKQFDVDVHTSVTRNWYLINLYYRFLFLIHLKTFIPLTIYRTTLGRLDACIQSFCRDLTHFLTVLGNMNIIFIIVELHHISISCNSDKKLAARHRIVRSHPINMFDKDLAVCDKNERK